MSQDAKNVKVVKVKPYPISLLMTLGEGKPPVRAQILKLTPVGYIARTPTEVFLVPHSTIHGEFDIPTTHHTIKTDVTVVKSYDRHLAGKQREHLVEFHFKRLSTPSLEAIEYFLKRIGSKE